MAQILPRLERRARVLWAWLFAPVHVHGCRDCAATWRCQDATCDQPTVCQCEACALVKEKEQARASAQRLRQDLRRIVARRGLRLAVARRRN